ncbi:hypothetical protein R1flu_028956 [Riccia fluitans]|uniref:Uncharacterized protein n=1 Tax=Riccia fluitans TaxID=41844 RepID=A0ABD1XNU2_9MARC
MEMNMRMFESEMYQQIQLGNCMLDEKTSPQVMYYTTGQHQGDDGTVVGGGGYWQMKEDGSIVLAQVSEFPNCSSSALSRSSSQMSTGSTENSSPSPLMYDNSGCYNVNGHRVQQHSGINVYASPLKAISLCSPLSEPQQRPQINIRGSDGYNSPVLQDLEVDDSPGRRYSHMEMVVGNNHRTPSIVGAQDLIMSSFMDSGVSGSHGNDRDSTIVTKVEFSDWSSGHCGLPAAAGATASNPPRGDVYSSPVNILDFPDSLTSHSPPSTESGHNVYSSPRHQQRFGKEEFEVPIGCDGGSQEGGGDQYHRWGMNSRDNHNNLFQANDFFHCQQVSPEISFPNCDPSGGFQSQLVPESVIRSEEDLNGVRLVHLLLAGAEATASMNADLATAILTQLRELASPSGNTMQRVAACFCEGLHYRIQGLRSADIGNSLRSSSVEYQNVNDSLDAFQVLHEVSPYIKFGHFTANQAILESFEGEKRVHIIDYEILEGIQWPSLMQALACRPGGPPQLRVTALSRPHVRRASAGTQETGKRLAEFAKTFNIPFSFHQIPFDEEEELIHPGFLRQVKGECLAVNCMVHLPHMPHRSQKSPTSFLRAVKRLSPKILTFIAEELPSTSSTFVGHFFEALHHYSAIFDSLEASLSAESTGRQLVERIFLAPRIVNLMTSINLDSSSCSEGGVKYWHSLPESEGFKPVPLSVYNHCQAKLLLGLFSDGYKVEEEQNRLLLGWRSKLLVGASVWQ